MSGRRESFGCPQTTLDSEFIVFEGISVDEEGNQHYLDATLAYKRAVLNAIKYLAQFGYTEEQVCVLVGCSICFTEEQV